MLKNYAVESTVAQHIAGRFSNVYRKGFEKDDVKRIVKDFVRSFVFLKGFENDYVQGFEEDYVKNFEDEVVNGVEIAFSGQYRYFLTMWMESYIEAIYNEINLT